MKIFCLDTSALIEPWHRLYPIDVFPGFWETLEAWAADGRIIAPEEVRVEIDRIDDGLCLWAKEKSFIFCPPEEAVQEAVTALLQAYPRLVDTKRGRSIADPWVIAQAQVSSAIVVTEEPRSNGRSPRIPDVCDGLGVTWTNSLGLIREMNIKF